VLLSLLANTLLATPAAAQAFLDPLTMPMGPTATAVLVDGTTVTGKPKVIPKGIGNIKKLTLKLEDGGKEKLTPKDVTELRLVPGGLAKGMAAMNAMSSISEMAKTNAGEAISREEVLYVTGTLPNGKPALLQLLNPGFEETIHVYPDPAGRETAKVGVGGMTVTGGAVKSYLVGRASGGETVLVKRQQYDKLWDELYGDCPAMAKPAEVHFDTMAADVAAHAKACGPNAGAAEPEPVVALEPAAEAEAVAPVEGEEPAEPAEADGEG
jgi:hypothetical protein